MDAIWLMTMLLVGAGAGALVMRLVMRTEYDAKVACLQTKLDAATSTADVLATAREELPALVRQGAGEELVQRGGELIELVKAHLDTALTQAGADDKARKHAMDQLVDPMKQTMTQLKDRLDLVDQARERTSTELTAKLETVTVGQHAVARNAAALERALRQPHARGRWGEFSLRRLVELAGMTELADFDEQSSISDDDRVLRPDMVVTLPGKQCLVVDAKVPLSPFLDAMQAGDEAERIQKLKHFAQAMRTHVRQLADKAYANQFPTAPNFVVMYLPGDHFLGGALEVDPELLDHAFTRGVHIATPATLLSMLRAAAYTVQQEKVAEDAQAIATLGRELYDRICVLLGHVDKVSQRLNSLVQAQDAVVGCVERRVVPKARKFSEFGVVGTTEELPEVRAVTAPARRVQAEELPTGEVHELPASAPDVEAA